MTRWFFKSCETKHYEERDAFFRGLASLDRRDFMRASAAAVAVSAAAGVTCHFQSFAPIRIAHAQGAGGSEQTVRIACISDSHLYERKINDRFVRSLLRAVDDVNALDPQPDFIFYGGDLAQLGKPSELELGKQILSNLKAPMRIMVGEHDWFLDLGEKWRDLFGEPHYSFDVKGVHFVVLQSVYEDDFWTERGMTPVQRMQTVAGLDNGIQSRFKVGEAQREWLKHDLSRIAVDTPIVVFSHSPLYKYYRPWNFWTDDADEVQAIFKPYNHVTVIHGHTHQILTNKIGNMHFHGMLSTAWPWPYAPEGLPELTIQMNRPDPFNPNDGLGDGEVNVRPDGLVDKLYNLWNRNPIQVSAAYVASDGKEKVPTQPNLASF